jgi:alkanesulfonate monooxygenase SsuD/methylene tetrahydromethanopterin reductase-like flavin-dependent oxidoreductase (luciferase family)
MALTGLAAATTSVRLATCVTQIAFRNPAVFARQALTLDHISVAGSRSGSGPGSSVTRRMR